MTAQNGLHNLPAPLRPAICAAPGHVFVRADLGQIEPRVLAVVSADRAFAEATRSDDLYAPVAAKLGADRPTAKVAVLAAMYGQRSGAAGEALKDLERAYPVAMGLLDRAYDDGVARRPVRTWGGRLIRFGAAPRSRRAADGRGRGAVPRRWPGRRVTRALRAQRHHPGVGRRAVQGLGRDGAPRGATAGRPDRAVPARRAARPRAGAAARRRGGRARARAASRTWAGTDQVRFVADTWSSGSEAKVSVRRHSAGDATLAGPSHPHTLGTDRPVRPTWHRPQVTADATTAGRRRRRP